MILNKEIYMILKKKLNVSILMKNKLNYIFLLNFDYQTAYTNKKTKFWNNFTIL